MSEERRKTGINIIKAISGVDEMMESLSVVDIIC